jgi:type II secretory pathway component PulF
MVIFLITFVIPQMRSVFDGLGNSLPWNTRFLMNLATFVTQDWLIIVIALAAIIIGSWVFMKTPAGAEARDRLLLKLPLIGKVIMRSTISRFSRVLGTLIYGGVPILEALEISGLSASNKVFLKSARAVEEEVRAGRPIAEAMRDAGEFPPVLVQMVAVGEETGDLPKMLGRVADSMDFEVDTAMRRLLALAEPIILLFMGGVVGFVVTSVMLPIYQAQSLVH